MSKKKADGMTVKEPTKLKLFREGIAEMSEFRQYKDLIMVLLESKKLYTPDEAKKILEERLHRRVDTNEEVK